MSLNDWIAICPDGVVTDAVIDKALELMAAQRAAKVVEPIPVIAPTNEGVPGDGIGGAGKEGDGELVDP